MSRMIAVLSVASACSLVLSAGRTLTPSRTNVTATPLWHGPSPTPLLGSEWSCYHHSDEWYCALDTDLMLDVSADDSY